jgi:hypothetical protein
MFNVQFDISNENGDVLWEDLSTRWLRWQQDHSAYGPDHQPVASLASLAPLDTLPARNGEIHLVQSSPELNSFYRCVIVGCFASSKLLLAVRSRVLRVLRSAVHSGHFLLAQVGAEIIGAPA